MKKSKFLIAALAAFAMLTAFTSCDDSDDGNNSTGAAKVIGKAFYYAGSETQNDKPIEETTPVDSGSDSSTDTGSDSTGEDSSSSSAPYTSTTKGTMPWIYFQTEQDAVYGTIGVTITTTVTNNGGTFESSKTYTPDYENITKDYHSYLYSASTANQIIYAFKQDYKYNSTNDEWEENYDVLPSSLKNAGIEESSEIPYLTDKDYEFGLKGDDFVIKLAEQKDGYKQWTTYTWKRMELKDSMKYVNANASSTGNDTDDSVPSYEGYEPESPYSY